MSLMDKAQSLLQRFTRPAAQGGDPSYTQRADGSLSGYHPNATQRQTARMNPLQEQPAEQAQWAPGAGYAQPGMDQPVADVWQSGAPQSFGQTAWQGYQPQAAWGQENRGGYTPTWQNPPMANQPGSPFEGYQGGAAPQMQPPVQQAPDNISYMAGSVVDQQGKAYRHSMRVAQITTVPDCYRLVAFMRSGESVLVNLDMMNERDEIGRCLDLLYGAAYALQCTFTRVAEGSLYLITPAEILVQPYDSISAASDREIDARWPDPQSVNYAQRSAAREQQGYGFGAQAASFGQTGYAAGSGFGAARNDSYTGFNRRVVGRSQNTGYTDFGGFGLGRR